MEGVEVGAIMRTVAVAVMGAALVFIAVVSAMGLIKQMKMKRRKETDEMFRAFIVCPVCGDSQELQNVPRHFRFKCPDCGAEMEGTVE